jgi:lysophospholipase L1-like esterase
MILKSFKTYFINFLILITSITIIFIVIETFLRIKNHFVINYDVEMWKYSKELKTAVKNLKINHIHKKNKSAILQNVEIKINSLGMRGDEEDIQNWQSSDLKILFIGSSIMLGWGVKEKFVLNNIVEDLAKKDDKSWATLNSGIGNYNTQRYVNNYLENNKNLNPDIIIVQYFINDAEILTSNRGNLITRNFHLGVLLWKYISLFEDDLSVRNIDDYYKKIYKDEKTNKIVKRNLLKLKKHCKDKNIRCILVYTPDIDLLKSGYNFKFIKKYLLEIVKELDMEFLDVTDAIKDNINLKMTNIEYKDRHPNSKAHEIIGETIYKYLIN